MGKINKSASLIDLAVEVAGVETIPDPGKRHKSEEENLCLDAALVVYKNLGLPDRDIAKIIPGVSSAKIWRAKQADRGRMSTSRLYKILKIRLENHLK